VPLSKFNAYRSIGATSPLGPGAVVIAYILIAEQLGEREPGVGSYPSQGELPWALTGCAGRTADPAMIVARIKRVIRRFIIATFLRVAISNRHHAGIRRPIDRNR